METLTPTRKTFAKVCQLCNNPFTALKSNALFCSNTCRSKASVKRTLLNGTESSESSSPSRAAIPMPPGATDPASTFIIDFLKKEVDKYEALYKEERSQRKDAKKKIDDLKEQIMKMDTDAKIAAQTAPQKGQLEGLADHPLTSKLMEHIGPALGELAMAAARKATASRPASPQALAGNEDSVWGQFTTWLSRQPEDVQRYVAELMLAFTQVQGDAEVLQKLYQVREMIMGQYMRATG